MLHSNLRSYQPRLWITLTDNLILMRSRPDELLINISFEIVSVLTRKKNSLREMLTKKILTRTGVPWIIIDYIEFSWSVSINFDNNRL